MSDWIQQVKTRGLAAPLRVLLDVLEPLGPLGAQVLYVAQPASALLGAADTVAQLAEALEEPGGVERLRRLLDE
ncbi:MAG: hypothetical protein K8J31_11645 [Anaerolineae bacterium]|nr:hypothetical protein [Anaerolineae bacterium]